MFHGDGAWCAGSLLIATSSTQKVYWPVCSREYGPVEVQSMEIVLLGMQESSARVIQVPNMCT